MIGPETKQIWLICNHLKPSSEVDFVDSQSVEIHTVLDDLLTSPPPPLHHDHFLNVTKQNKIILFCKL